MGPESGYMYIMLVVMGMYKMIVHCGTLNYHDILWNKGWPYETVLWKNLKALIAKTTQKTCIILKAENMSNVAFNP